MALTSGVPDPIRRGPAGPGAFGYPVAPGEKIFRGGIVAVNASGQLVRVQTAGAVQIVGMASQDYDNSANASASTDLVVAEKGIWRLPVTGGDASHINVAVFATDDASLTITNSGSLLTAGTIAGIENANTYVKLIGS